MVSIMMHASPNTRWSSVVTLLVLLLVSLVVTEAKVSPTLHLKATEATKRNPQLRALDTKRRERFLEQVKYLAVPSKSRALEEQEDGSQDGDAANEDADAEASAYQGQGYNGNSNGGGGYNIYTAYDNEGAAGQKSQEEQGDSVSFTSTGFGEKWNSFYSGMKSWGSNVSNAVKNSRGSNTNGADQQTTTASATEEDDSDGQDQGYGTDADETTTTVNQYYSENYWANGDDDASVTWESYEGMQDDDFGFGMTNYNFMFTGCSNVQSYSNNDNNSDENENDEEGEEQQEEARLERYATFRLCPATTCSDNTFRGCKYNYGEYVVKMDDFLMAMVEFNEQRLTGFCEYCQECADIEAFDSFYATVGAQKQVALMKAESHYSQWYQSKYGDNGNNNNNANDNYNSNNSADTKYYKMLSSNSKYSSSSSSSSNYGGNANGYSANSGNSNSGYSGYGSKDQSAWQSMGEGAGTWYGLRILNGYYDEYGQFNLGWGYFSGYDGSFVSLEDEEIVWDPSIFGEWPESWDEDWLNGGELVEQCNSKYTSDCADEYESCMQLLADEEDYENYRSYQQQRTGVAPALSLKEYLECTAVDMDQFAYLQAQKQTYEQNVKEQQEGYYGYQGAECDEDDEDYEDCIAAQEADEADADAEEGEEEVGQLYIGPHCGGDGLGVSLAVYTDEYCSSYANKYTVEEVLGVTVKEDEIDFFPHQCVSCVDELMYDGEEVEDGEDGINPLCSYLYEKAGKCNRNMDAGAVYSSNYDQTNDGDGDGDADQDQEGAQQEFVNEQDACMFIESLRPQDPDKVAGGMIALFVLLGVAGLLLAAWAIRLQGKLNCMKHQNNSRWDPRKATVAPAKNLASSKKVAIDEEWTTGFAPSRSLLNGSVSGGTSPPKSVAVTSVNSNTNNAAAAAQGTGVIGFGFDAARSGSPFGGRNSSARAPFLSGNAGAAASSVCSTDSSDVSINSMQHKESVAERVKRIESEMQSAMAVSKSVAQIEKDMEGSMSYKALKPSSSGSSSPAATDDDQTRSAMDKIERIEAEMKALRHSFKAPSFQKSAPGSESAEHDMYSKMEE